VDAELIAYLDQRFAEVRGDIATSAAGVKDELRAEVAASAASLRGEIAASAAGLRGEITASAAALRGEITASAAGLRVDISAEMSTHIGAVVEDLISKMELVVEGIRTVDRRLLRLHARVSGRRRRRPGR